MAEKMRKYKERTLEEARIVANEKVLTTAQ